ncbi:MAG: DUF456 domain-containing protein [Candidatus Marinimicrobia bacterium]|nr:DUF456 domain-containing protein [Candidatus Neomarinimicrobiota bacterium]
MDILLITISALLILIGILGSVVPILPGPPIAYCGLLLVQFTSKHPFSVEFLIIFGLLAIFSAIIDNILPIYTTKKFNGSKKGIWGSAIGLIIGLFFFPPFGILIGSMLGAFIGEILDGKSPNNSIKPAFGSFIGFLSSIFLRFALSVVMAYYFVVKVFVT